MKAEPEQIVAVILVIAGAGFTTTFLQSVAQAPPQLFAPVAVTYKAKVVVVLTAPGLYVKLVALSISDHPVVLDPVGQATSPDREYH